MSGNYTPTNSGYSTHHNPHGHANRLGTRSASNSPPGTPPSGLRNYYLNAAYQRSQNRFHAMGSAPGSSTSLHRPSLSVTLPLQSTRVQGPQEPQRSYSADCLKVHEPEITVTTPGGTNSTENHVISLERALSKLVEDQDREAIDEEDESDGFISMRISKPISASSSPPGTPGTPGTPPHRKGIIKFPKVVTDRYDTEKAAEASTSAAVGTTVLTHDAEGSEVTLTGLGDAPESTERDLANTKEKGKAKRRTPRLFHRYAAAPATEQNHTTTAADLARQPSKAGVLSNLLKLHTNGRHHHDSYQAQQHKPSKTPKGKKQKRPGMYSRSAGNSFASIRGKSFLGTYPDLPATDQSGINTTLSNFQPNPNRPSFQYESYSVQPSPFQSPYHSPGGSRRASLSGGESPSIFGYPYYGGDGLGGGSSGDSSTIALSNEEKIRITNAVADILERQDYILQLAKSMIKYGAPSHRLEETIDHSAKLLELNLQCIYMPNVMIISFTDFETHTSETHLLRVSAGLNMCKVALVHRVQKMISHSSTSVEEAIMKLDAINSEKDIFPRWLTILGYGMASFCAAPMFFHGSWIDAGVSFLAGAAVSLLVWLSERLESYSHIGDVTMSVVVAFVAEALRNSNVCVSAVKLAGVVIILPGFTITSGILELSSRHMISGSVRLFYAVIFSLLLGYGLVIGTSLWKLIYPASQNEEAQTACPGESLSALWNILFVPLFAVSLNIWLKAHPRQWPTSIILSIVGYSISYTTTVYAGAKTEVSSALSAFAIGLIGNVYQRWTQQLMYHAVVCAVFFLVPGSLGLKGAMSLFTDDMTGGVNFAIQMITTAIAISVGLFASTFVVYPFGKTRSAQMTF
ncbi:hypothetical protein BGX20_001392 [Mortierella sp. AD010]|nr:hypothetical protein BGX20_001392 [Mortierella sp. AD010]